MPGIPFLLSGCSQVSCEALSFKTFSSCTLDQASLLPWAWEGTLLLLPRSFFVTTWWTWVPQGTQQ